MTHTQSGRVSDRQNRSKEVGERNLLSRPEKSEAIPDLLPARCYRLSLAAAVGARCPLRAVFPSSITADRGAMGMVEC